MPYSTAEQRPIIHEANPLWIVTHLANYGILEAIDTSLIRDVGDNNESIMAEDFYLRAHE